MTESSPNTQDLVLGGQLPPPVNGAVLGGLLGLQQRFEQSELAQKLAALKAAEKYGEEAIPLLRQGLEDADLTVRSTAYSQLRQIGVSFPDLERGLPLRVGDRIYTVYESSVSYGDDWYYIYAEIDEEEDEDEDEDVLEEYSLYHLDRDSDDRTFEYISNAPKDNQRDPYDEGYEPIWIAHCLDSAIAEEKAEAIYEEKFGKLGCEIYEIGRYSESEDSPSEAFDLRSWVEANQIVVDAKLPEGWGDDDWAYENRVLLSLQNQKNLACSVNSGSNKGIDHWHLSTNM